MTAAEPIFKPLGLLAELTHRCPLGCPYCSNPVALDRDELDTATWARVFREAAGLGVLQVHLSGGEFWSTLSGRYALRRTLYRSARLTYPGLLGFSLARHGMLLPTGAMVTYCNQIGCEFISRRLARSVMLLEELRERPIVHAPC
jgi:hypothetical protein